MLRNKKSTLKFLSYGTAFSFLSFLSFNILFPPVATNAESSATANLELEIEPSIEVAVDTQALALSYNNETDILPTSEGVTATGDVNVYVTTNGASGYILSLYTQNSTNSMKHINTNISNAITATAADAASLTGNTWGYKLGNDNWNPVSASAEAPAVIVDNGASNTTLCDGLSDKTGNPAALEQCVTNGSASKATITFGANITDSLPAGRYTNDVVFSAISKDPITPQEPTMQDFDPSSLAEGEITTLVDSRDNHKYKVKKLPDGKVWMIQNLTLSADDMVTEGKALTSANTNIPASDTNSYYVPPRNTRYDTDDDDANAITNSAVATASTKVSFYPDVSNHPQVAYKAKGDTNHDTGNALPEDTAWYSFYTATLGFSYNGDGKSSGSSPRDICPKGWRLPKVSDNGTSVVAASSEFANLARTYNSSASWGGSDTGYNYSTSDDTIRKNMILGDSGSLDPTLEDNGAAGFTYAGFYDGTTLYNVGTRGFYWSSSVYGSDGYYNYGYYLHFGTPNVFPQDDGDIYSGLAVRCVTGS